jgi:hypothetical protein
LSHLPSPVLRCGPQSRIALNALARGSITAARRVWRGEVPLAQVFWRWAILGGVIVNALTTFLFLVLMAADQATVAFVIHLLAVPYNAGAAFAVWKSADRYSGDRLWADLARLIVIVWATLLSVV